jgi:glycosyltransferase involved in cell wall biosynthesis
VHPRNDTRIFIKQCRSLARNNFDVWLVVADGKDDEQHSGVNIIDVGKASGRWQRIMRMPKRVYRAAVSLDADVYHLHDPELLPIGLKLKRAGKRVIFDAHEDFSKQLLSKPYLSEWVKKPLSCVAEWYENKSCKQFDAVVAATPFIRDRFLTINPKTIDINNFPIIGELGTDERKNIERNEVCFVGGYSVIRGLHELIVSLPLTTDIIKLNLVGECSDKSFQSSLEQVEGWHKVNKLGFLDRPAVAEILRKSFAGIVTFHAVPNHINAQPNKMFEYMSAGVPVIGSDFTLWKDIIEGSDCGICVDPTNPREIAEAINYLYHNPEIAYQKGVNGQKAIIEKYNWQQEEMKLLRLYQQLN